jgi:hypothetical protein
LARPDQAPRGHVPERDVQCHPRRDVHKFIEDISTRDGDNLIGEEEEEEDDPRMGRQWRKTPC